MTLFNEPGTNRNHDEVVMGEADTGQQSLPRFILAWIAELVLLLVILAICLLWGAAFPSPFGYGEHDLLMLTSDPANLLSEYMLTSVGGAFAVLAGMLVLSRIRQPAWLTILLCFAWFGVCGWFSLERRFLPELREIYKAAHDLPRQFVYVLPAIYLPGAALQLVRLTLWALVSFLSGVYAAGRHYGPLRFMMGSLLGGWVAALLLVPVMQTFNMWIFLQPVAFAVLGRLTFALPIQRRAWSRLFRVSSRGVPAPSEVVFPNSAGRFAGHISLVLILLVLGSFPAIGILDRQMARTLTQGPPPVYRDASMQNAYPILKNRFMKKESSLKTFNRNFSTTALLFMMHGEFHHINDKENWDRHDTPELRRALVSISPYLDDFTSASQCDYLDWPAGSPWFSFLVVRETARSIHTRTMLAIHDRNTTAALANIESLLRFWGIMRHHPMLVTQMVGCAVCGIASDACYQYFIAMHDDPAAMEQIAQLFERRAQDLDVRLDWEMIQKGEPGFWDVVSHTELLVPAFRRAELNTMGRHVQFQQLQQAVALQLYKVRHGHYPTQLKQLVPEFLDRLPLDPYEGNTYVYRPQDHDFTLTTNRKVDTDSYEGPLDFPLLTVEETKRKVEQRMRKAGIQTNRNTAKNHETTGAVTSAKTTETSLSESARQ